MPYRFLVFAVLFLGACDPCRNLDCVADSYSGQFRMVQAATGKDLLFGPDHVYNNDSIRFFSLQGADTVYYHPQLLSAPGNGFDSVLVVRFLPKADTAYMQLNGSDIDTLQLQFQTYDTRCCGTITEITNVRFNNKTNLPGKGTQVLPK